MFNTQGMFWNDWLSIWFNEGEEKKSSRWQYCTVLMQLESTAHALIFPLPWLPFISHSSFCLWLNPFCSNHNFQRDQQLATEIKLMKGFQPFFLPASLPPEIFSEVSLYCCFPSDLHIAMQCIGCTLYNCCFPSHWLYNRCSAAGVHWFPSKSSGVAGSRLPTHYPGVTV